ncbi:helix-turn-helix domain-containing protein [Streptomyces coeruleorubidus]|uniref:helix-turn-helix domain-containing protein n=1 Tax=Streptomyces coeruleorubidus TaxID=116188 RepID=UPI00378EC9D0
MEHLVKRSIATIHARFHEPLSLDDLAHSAMISKFYFLRLFRRVTGVTPGRFLSAVRLHEAKRLLLSTSLNVADVSAEVGYSSTGTFSRRFSESVGISPTRYRRLQHADGSLPPEHTRNGNATASLTGVLNFAGAPDSAVYLGLFSSPILQGYPVATATATAPGVYQMRNIPSGTWYLHAVSRVADSSQGPHPEAPILIDRAGPLRFSANTSLTTDLFLQPSDWTRPPILFALTGLDPLPCAPGPVPPVPLVRVPSQPRRPRRVSHAMAL